MPTSLESAVGDNQAAQGLNIRWLEVPTSHQSAVGDIEAAQAHLMAVGAALRRHLAVGDSGDQLVAATTSASSSSRDPLAFHVGGQTELAVDSKSAVDDPMEKTGAFFGDTKSVVADSTVSVGSAYISEDMKSARPYAAVIEGHVFHATPKTFENTGEKKNKNKKTKQVDN